MKKVECPLFLFLFILLLPSCSKEEPSPTSTAPSTAEQEEIYEPSGEYAGSESCDECHEEAYREWKDSHHALAQRELKAEQEDAVFNPPKTIKHGTKTSYAQEKDGGYRMTMIGADGNEADFEPVGALGAYPLWQYLIRQEGGRLQVTELAWDPEAKEWFNVYKDEDRQYWEWGSWPNRGMNWNSMCANCHNTAFEKNYEAQTDSYSSSYKEMGIGCEQCHGPMKDHVDWQEAHPQEEESEEVEEEFDLESALEEDLEAVYEDPTLFWIDRDQHFSICGSCHARRGDVTDKFVVGDDFHHHYELILPDYTNTYYPDGQIWDEDFELAAFMLSNMYNKDVRCVDCHNPHTAKVSVEGNDLCQRCHEAGVPNKIPIDALEHGHHPLDKEGSLCKDCHMPQTPYMARHWRHDHGMTIPDPLLTKELGIPNACSRCHEEEGLDWNIDYVEQWYGDRMNRPTRDRARLLAGIKQGQEDKVPGIVDLLVKEENATWRAVYVKFLTPLVPTGTAKVSREKLMGEMLRLLDDDSPLVQSAAIDALEPLAGEVADKLRLKLRSPNRLVRVKAAWALRRELDYKSQAGRELLARLDFNQDQPLGVFQRGHLYADTGRDQLAAQWFKKAIDWDPGVAAFRYSYAVALSKLKQPEEAIIQITKALELEPNESRYAYSLGLLYAEVGQMWRSRNSLRAAVEIEPGEARYWYNLSLAEFSLRQVEAAFDAISNAEDLAPKVPDYPYTRGTFHYRLGQHDRARQVFKRALQIDPNYGPALQYMTNMQ
ncbi:MAG: tetratricopeptide repeat protein [Planctomycetota bacterium]